MIFLIFLRGNTSSIERRKLPRKLVTDFPTSNPASTRKMLSSFPCLQKLFFLLLANIFQFHCHREKSFSFAKSTRNESSKTWKHTRQSANFRCLTKKSVHEVILVPLNLIQKCLHPLETRKDQKTEEIFGKFSKVAKVSQRAKSINLLGR